MSTPEDKYLTILTKILAKEASKEEHKALQDWAAVDEENQAFVDETMKTWDLSGKYADDIPVDADAAWEKFEQKLPTMDAAVPSSPVQIIQLTAIWKVAAVVLFSLCAWWSVQQFTGEPEWVEVLTEKNEEQEILLPDGSTVFLNENSSFAYQKDFSTRTVKFEGEAFFDVAKDQDRPFEIVTSSTKTIVLGTSFNLRAYANEATVEVAVVTGKVAFETSAKGGAKLVLSPNEQAVFDKNVQTINKTSSKNAVAWRTKTLSFNNTALKEVVASLERYFEIEIESQNPNVLNCHYTGTFEAPKLQEIFDAVSFSNDLVIKKVEKKYILIGQGCD